ncbi:hypothetical protein AGMMS49525_07450 [Bacteroidia bacterium]|nr:hypothetical protein AGMMS49525_07450 [Bacteroidia bacterium]
MTVALFYDRGERERRFRRRSLSPDPHVRVVLSTEAKRSLDRFAERRHPMLTSLPTIAPYGYAHAVPAGQGSVKI